MAMDHGSRVDRFACARPNPPTNVSRGCNRYQLSRVVVPLVELKRTFPLLFAWRHSHFRCQIGFPRRIESFVILLLQRGLVWSNLIQGVDSLMRYFSRSILAFVGFSFVCLILWKIVPLIWRETSVIKIYMLQDSFYSILHVRFLRIVDFCSFLSLQIRGRER